MEKTRQCESWPSELERLAAKARQAPSPELDVSSHVIAALRRQEIPSVDRPLAWLAAFSGAGAVAAAVYIFSLVDAVTDPFAQWFQIGTMMIF